MQRFDAMTRAIEIQDNCVRLIDTRKNGDEKLLGIIGIFPYEDRVRLAAELLERPSLREDLEVADGAQSFLDAHNSRFQRYESGPTEETQRTTTFYPECGRRVSGVGTDGGRGRSCGCGAFFWAESVHYDREKRCFIARAAHG